MFPSNPSLASRACHITSPCVCHRLHELCTSQNVVPMLCPIDYLTFSSHSSTSCLSHHDFDCQIRLIFRSRTRFRLDVLTFTLRLLDAQGRVLKWCSHSFERTFALRSWKEGPAYERSKCPPLASAVLTEHDGTKRLARGVAVFFWASTAMHLANCMVRVKVC